EGALLIEGRDEISLVRRVHQIGDAAGVTAELEGGVDVKNGEEEIDDPQADASPDCPELLLEFASGAAGSQTHKHHAGTCEQQKPGPEPHENAEKTRPPLGAGELIDNCRANGTSGRERKIRFHFAVLAFC